MRVAVTGVPRAGKTTSAFRYGARVRRADDLIATHDWSAQSAAIAGWLEDPDPDLVVEGMAVARGLRKWLAAHPGDARPVDRLVVHTAPVVPVTETQARAGRGCLTVVGEIAAELAARGVAVEYV